MTEQMAIETLWVEVLHKIVVQSVRDNFGRDNLCPIFSVTILVELFEMAICVQIFLRQFWSNCLRWQVLFEMAGVGRTLSRVLQSSKWLLSPQLLTLRQYQEARNKRYILL